MRKHSFFITLSTIAVVFLSSCQGQPFTEEDFNKKLFPNGFWDLIIQLTAFVILLLIVFFLGYKPLKRMLEKRRQYVETQLSEAEQAKIYVQEATVLAEQEVAKGKVEAANIIAEAKTQAEAEAAAIIQEARDEAAARRVAADEEIRLAQEASKQEIREQIIDVALQASQAVLGRNVETPDNQRMIDELIDELDGGK